MDLIIHALVQKLNTFRIFSIKSNLDQWNTTSNRYIDFLGLRGPQQVAFQFNAWFLNYLSGRHLGFQPDNAERAWLQAGRGRPVRVRPEGHPGEGPHPRHHHPHLCGRAGVRCQLSVVRCQVSGFQRPRMSWKFKRDAFCDHFITQWLRCPESKTN